MRLFRFKAQHKRKAGSVLQAPLAGLQPVQANTIIEAKQAKHWQKETRTQPYAAPQLEGVVLLKAVPAVCRIKKRKTVDGAAGIRYQRVPKLQLVFVEYGKELLCLVNIRIERRVGRFKHRVAAQGNDVVAQQTLVIGNTITTHLEALKRRYIQLAIVAAHKAVLGRQL